MQDSVYRQTFLANEDWAESQRAYVYTFMKNQVKFKEAQDVIAATGDTRKLTPYQELALANKDKLKKARLQATQTLYQHNPRSHSQLSHHKNPSL